MAPTAKELERGRELASELTDQIEGEVRFEPGDRAIYSTDASSYRQLPIGVVIAFSALVPAVPTAVVVSFGGGPTRHSATTASAATISAGIPSLTTARLAI